MKLLASLFTTMVFSLSSAVVSSQSLKPLEFGVGLFQPDKEKERRNIQAVGRLSGQATRPRSEITYGGFLGRAGKIFGIRGD